MEKGIFMKTQKNEEAFKEFCIMTPFAAREVDCWYDGKDFYEVIVVMNDGSVHLYDSFEHSDLYFKTLGDLFKIPEDEDEWRKQFSYNLYRVMRRNGLSQIELSEESGISPAMITKYMNGESTPTAYKMTKIANALRCNIDDLIYF